MAVTVRMRGKKRPPTAGELADAMATGRARAMRHEAAFARAVTGVLREYGDRAARRFEEHATDHLTAGGVRSPGLFQTGHPMTSSMVAVRPRADEAARIALTDGESADSLHVTLAIVTGDQVTERFDELQWLVRDLANENGRMVGEVTGVAVFGDNGNGFPQLALPSAVNLAELRHAVVEKLVEAGFEPNDRYGWIPHITLRYGKTADAPPSDVIREPLHFDNLTLARGTDPDREFPLAAAMTASVTATSEKGKEIGAVAEKHAPEGGYGDTAWNEGEGVVAWVSADWSTNEEVDAAVEAFLAVDGVVDVDHDAEMGLPDGDGWEIVYREGRLGLTASPVYTWTAPLPDEMLDLNRLMLDLRTKTDPVRLAAIRDSVTPALRAAGLSFDVTNPLVLGIIDRTATHVTGIADTTRTQLQAIMGRAYDQGLSIPDTSKLIRAAMSGASDYRGTMIARTEMTRLVNAGQSETMGVLSDITGEAYSKTWLTAPGAEHPRHEDYEGLDGQTVALDEPFDVGGEPLMYPGDEDGSPDETINCRCTLTYGEASAADGSGDAITPDTATLDQNAEDGSADAEAQSIANVTMRTEDPIPTPTFKTEELTLPSDPYSEPLGEPIDPHSIEEIGAYQLDTPLQDVQQGPVARDVLHGYKSTAAPVDRNGKLLEDGLWQKQSGEWLPERQQLHDEIRAKHFEGKTPCGASGKRAYFTSGGAASGKTSAMFTTPDGRLLNGEQMEAADPCVVYINPDTIKAMLPEGRAMLDAGDPYYANGVHEESSIISKQILQEAYDEGFSVVLDTTGAGNSFIGKLATATENGYEVQVSMASIPVNDAIDRMVLRGDRYRRYVSLDALKDSHARSSQALPKWARDPNVKSWRLVDNALSGQARLVASATDGKITVYEPKLWRDILAKANPPSRADAFAAQTIKLAAESEPATTEALTAIATDLHGQMVGLQYAVKTPESLARKIRSDLAEALVYNPDATVEEVASAINDVLRYTMQFDSEHYAAGVEETIAKLKAAGYREVKVKNFWHGVDYRGINAVFDTPSGQHFELQFHTPESFALKDGPLHKLYEAYRAQDASTPEGFTEKVRLWKQMERLTAQLPTPPGADTIGKLAEHAAPEPPIAELVPGPSIEHELQVISRQDDNIVRQLARTNSSLRSATPEERAAVVRDYRAKVAASIDKLIKDAEIHVRTGTEELKQILRDGRYKTQFETQSSGGLLNNAYRAGAEKEMFGYHFDLPPEKRPVYGYLANSAADAENTDQYGDVAIQLKDEARARTTYAMTDSLEGGNDGYLLPQPLVAGADPSLAADYRYHLPNENATKILPDMTLHYAEAQIHGGVTLADIEKVSLPNFSAAELSLRERISLQAQIAQTAQSIMNGSGGKQEVADAAVRFADAERNGDLLTKSLTRMIAERGELTGLLDRYGIPWVERAVESVARV